MSVWRCPACGREMRNDETASFEVAPIVKQRGGGGFDQFSIGGTRRTCPDHPGLRLERFDRIAPRVGQAFVGGVHGHA